MRLIVVALLGIEISIIALASAASADTHPEGSPAESGPYEAEPVTGTARTPAEFLSDANDMGQRPWAFERLVLVHGRLAELPDWPPTDPRWPLAAVGRAEVVAERAAGDDATKAERADDSRTTTGTLPGAASGAAPAAAAAAAGAAGARGAATKALKSPVRRRAARMPKARPRAAHRRAQVDLTRTLPRMAAVRMTHATASGWLESAGLRTKSTGNCASKHGRRCTSLDSVRTGTVARAIELKRESGCPIMVTGGTERGHAPGHFSHGNGYKLDISHNDCIDRHITKNHHKAGVRGDGARLYKSDSGTTFADEHSHWDILFR
ncbi:hypothetical protein FAF44_30590 [Nonomuraea sp. MG754425]|uniref:hypothetical protein n=1 Tax=Nonomuraea sp. MG754425 TaxID=2570319 RepID=UPI001F29EF60|nr:hypothetical protein [Nonomuraea sp. MG754425]MCF6472713.1 hypothetical protein [Nonomuraea sp. MG754425]